LGLSIFGVRHHGPGCARALKGALLELQPDIVLVEGPPDAHAVLPLLQKEEMKPPVALLIYLPDQPHRAVYYPFTEFSPEWQALVYSFERGIPARFMDLPQAMQLGTEPTPPEPDSGGLQPASDPLAMLAEAAGYDDHELWWERQVEVRRDATGLFEGILEAMTALRSRGGNFTPESEHEAAREAYMRRTIRAAQEEGFRRIAVVCGAWHSPVLGKLDDEDGDARTLKDLFAVKVEATWIPWTNSRLSYRTGYGAGIASPGWYTHLWEAPDRMTIRWVTHAAHLLREEGLDVPSSGVIDAVRLGETLAAMGELPMPGLHELHEAIQTVLCHGAAEPMELIREKLEIGEKMGEVPTETPTVPLQRDLEAHIKSVKLKQSPETVTLALDLRVDLDRSRSRLLHRLRLLGINWGEQARVSGSVKGTFHENWQLRWDVAFAVDLIERNIWGNTIESATIGFVHHRADEAGDLPELTALLSQVNLADLPDATEYVLARVESSAAVSADVRHLMDALPSLGEVVRYGDVRGTRAERITPVIMTLFARILIGLPGACASLDDEAAAAMVMSIDHVQDTIKMLGRDDMFADWLPVLRRLAETETVHGLVRGHCCRLLVEQRALDETELQRLARLSLSPAIPTAQAAAWIEGVVRGTGRVLLDQDGLWRALDTWLAGLSADVFVALLPLLRRAFSGFSSHDLRSMGKKVARLRAGGQAGDSLTGEEENLLTAVNYQRADQVVPVLARILGVEVSGGGAQ
jgi:hypothetical protein